MTNPLGNTPTDVGERLRQLRSEMELRFTGEFAENAVNTLDVAAQALTTLAAEKAMIVEWQPIETAKRDGSPILAVWLFEYEGQPAGGHNHQVVRWVGGEHGWWDCEGFTMPTPSHWMPLPAPPKGDYLPSRGGGER